MNLPVVCRRCRSVSFEMPFSTFDRTRTGSFEPCSVQVQELGSEPTGAVVYFVEKLATDDSVVSEV